MSSEDVRQDTYPARIKPSHGFGELTPVRSSEAGRELVRKRWDNMSRAVRAGVAKAGEALPAVNAHSSLKVIEYLSEEHAKHASVPGARGAVSSFDMILRHGWPRPEREQGVSDTGEGLTIHMDGELAQRLLERLAGGKVESSADTP